jgi:hypothetical protein
MAKKRLKVGHVLEIPLSMDRKAYGQYVFADKRMGPLFQVFDLITDTTVQLEELRGVKAMFPPVITGLRAAVRLDLWKVVGWIPVEEFVYPNFVSTLYNQKTGKAGIWFLWNGTRDIRIGSKLPEKYKKLEFLIVWSPCDVATRIETGYYPFPYRELIQNNEFTPILSIR